MAPSGPKGPLERCFERPKNRISALFRGALLLLLAILALGTAPAFAKPQAEQAGREVTIGVLALRGEEKVEEFWQPTIDYLGDTLPQYRFTLQPLGFDEIHLAVRQRQVDFVLANSAYYVDLEMRYGASPVVTMKTRIGDGPAVQQFGGVIFSRADRGKLRDIADLKRRDFAAVDPGSFGGWHAGWRTLLENGLNPERDFRNLYFLGTHDAVVEAVLDGHVDAGTARTGTLEQMAREGSIDLSDFYIIHAQYPAGYPYQLSSALYPEWPLAKLPNVPDAVAVDVAVALMRLPEDHPATKAAHIAGWTLPLNYQPVHDALRTLRIGPYEYLRHLTPGEVLEQYWQYLVMALLALLLALSTVVYVFRMNRRLRQHHRELREVNATLEARVTRRTADIESLLAQETHLRGIVETVADVNQIIITSDSPRTMLKATCDRLVGHREYRFAWVAELRDDELALTTHAYGPAEYLRYLVDLSPDGLACQAIDQNRSRVSEELLAPWEAGNHNGDLDGLTARVALPLRPNAFSDAQGVICVFTRREGGFDREELAMLEQLAGDLGFALHAFAERERNAALQRDQINNYEETILSMVDMIEKRDTYTAGHSRRVANYCEKIARELGQPEEEIRKLNRAAILHDIGKIVIPDSVLLKPGRLTDLEFELIKQHVAVGYETLANIDMYKDLAEMMHHHHEWLDGSGYPQGLKGDEISFAGRIMAVADAFDAMTSNRIYKPRKEVDQALAELKSLAGKHYDPEVVDAACRALRGTTPPSAVDQLPKTAIEKQRFAYFFNDQLTGFHNADYLEFILKTGLSGMFKQAWVVYLRHFAQYNMDHGWMEGDRLLHDFAAYLGDLCPDGLIFRVMGDDFVILNPHPRPLEAAHIKATSPLHDSDVNVEITEIDLRDGNLAPLQTLIVKDGAPVREQAPKKR